MSDTVIRRAAFSLNPERPIMTLAGLARTPRSTAKRWATGRRRPSVVILKILRDKLKDRQAALFQLIAELDCAILQRECESKRRTGFNLIDPITGLDRRNRLGRPRAGHEIA
jgi:hypothetical protein